MLDDLLLDARKVGDWLFDIEFEGESDFEADFEFDFHLLSERDGDTDFDEYCDFEGCVEEIIGTF